MPLQPTQREEIREKFNEKFPMDFFATQDWNYDFDKDPSEFQFKSWQEKQTNIALTKQDMLYNYWLSVLDQELAKRNQELREKVKTMGGVQYPSGNEEHWLERSKVLALLAPTEDK